MVLFHSSVRWLIVVSLFCTITGMIWASSNFLKINNVNISFLKELQNQFYQEDKTIRFGDHTDICSPKEVEINY